MKTQALIFREANRFETVELTLPKPGPTDILVRTLVSAISPGTERWVLRGKHIGTQFPCVPGYHRIGVVEARGAEVADFEVGDVVYGSGGRWRNRGIVSMWGAHVGHSVSPCDGYQFIASSLPGRFELETLAFTILAGVATRGIRFLNVRPTEKVCIIGAGFIGLCAAQLCTLRGAAAVLLDKDPERVVFARRLVPNALGIDDKTLDAKLAAQAPAGFDALYDTVGHPATTDAMVRKVRRHGRLLLQAQYFDRTACAIDLDQIKIRELTVKTTCGVYDEDFTETAAAIRSRRLQIAPLITHRFAAPADLLKGYRLLDKGKPFNIGIVFLWDAALARGCA